MPRLSAALLLVMVCAAWPCSAARLTLERVVLVQRHGVRPPTSGNEVLARFAAQPWPAWPVATGELTPHGGETVRLMGETLGAAYRAQGLLPAHGCPTQGSVSVWADGTDQRTRRSGQVLGEALAPGCGVPVAWAAPEPRDPIFGGSAAPACQIDARVANAEMARAAGPAGVDTPATRAALARLQAILAPKACAGGAGMCFRGDDKAKAGSGSVSRTGPTFLAASLAEDILLEYAQGMPLADVGWGRVGSAAGVAAVMAVHERPVELLRRASYIDDRLGAPMARLVLAALAGEVLQNGPQTGPQVKILALAGHDTNLTLMAAIFGLRWVLPGEPDATPPAGTLAFELWRDAASGERYVRPVVWYETLDQLRTLRPARASELDVKFQGCASGPKGTCPLAQLRSRALALLPAGCGDS